MNIEELYNDVERDLKIDDTELDLESIRTPQIHNKYLKLYTKHSLQYKKLQDDYKVLYNLYDLDLFLHHQTYELNMIY